MLTTRDVALPEFVLALLRRRDERERERAAFVRFRSPVLPGSDQITGHEALYPGKCGFPLHRIGDVRGLGVTTSAAIPASFRPTAFGSLPFAPLSPPLSISASTAVLLSLFLSLGASSPPIVLFLVNTRSTPSFRDSARRMGFSRGNRERENGRKRFRITIYPVFRPETFRFAGAKCFTRQAGAGIPFRIN